MPEPLYWENIWSKGLKPGERFDATRSSPAFVAVLESELSLNSGAGKCALVPGCGRGYDVVELAKRGYDAVGWEISETAQKEASKYVKDSGATNGRVDVVDFFDASKSREKFDVIYDYTFFCAINPEQREAWAKRMSCLVKAEEGVLVTQLFPLLPDKKDGPPFGISVDIAKDLLEAVGFSLVTLKDIPEEMSHPGRENLEKIALWKLLPKSS